MKGDADKLKSDDPKDLRASEIEDDDEPNCTRRQSLPTASEPGQTARPSPESSGKAK